MPIKKGLNQRSESGIFFLEQKAGMSGKKRRDAPRTVMSQSNQVLRLNQLKSNKIAEAIKGIAPCNERRKIRAQLRVCQAIKCLIDILRAWDHIGELKKAQVGSKKS